ncbi:MAG: ATP-binding protein, partial [Eubacteriales bacterium]|nr:ATP-binding protein [Eubacteriales bacterium]
TAGACHIGIDIAQDSARDALRIRISDDGSGMDAQTLSRVRDPFTTSRTTRKVGLGIPLFMAGALGCNGSFDITSRPGEGTAVSAAYQLSHLDIPPLGDIAGTLYMLMSANPDIDFTYTHTVDGRRFEVDGAQIRTMLDGVPLTQPDVGQWMMEYLQEGIKGLYGGA